MKVILKKKANLQKPVYKTLKVSDICIPDYQRARLSMSLIKKYAENFDWDIFGVPLVSYRNGKYYAVDGQHRLEVLKMLGIETVLYQVLTGLTYEEEADKFVRLNVDHKLLNAADKFHGKVESKDKSSLCIRDILKSNNLTYSKILSEKNTTTVFAIRTVEIIYNKKGGEHLNRLLNILKNAWYGEPSAFSSIMMQGMSTFLSNSRGINEGILVSALERKMPKDIILSANLFANQDGMMVNSDTRGNKPHVAKVIRELYNAEKARLKTHNIIH